MRGSWLILYWPLQGRIGTSLAWPNLMAKFGFVPGWDWAEITSSKKVWVWQVAAEILFHHMLGALLEKNLSPCPAIQWKHLNIYISPLLLHCNPPSSYLSTSTAVHCGASSPRLWPPGSTWWEVARRRQAARPALAHSFAGLRGCVREGLDTVRGCVMNVGDRCRRWTSPICSRFIHRYTRTTVDSTNSPQESLSLLVPQIQICFIF